MTPQQNPLPPRPAGRRSAVRRAER